MRTPKQSPVVVGVNSSAASLAAVRLGAREAVARGRKLRVVHAFSWPDPRFGRPPQGYAQSRREASRLVDRAVAAAQRSVPGVKASGLVADGLAVRVLVQQSRGAELLVLGDEDDAPVDSVLYQAVSRAFCPTVVARGPRPPSGPLLACVDGSDESLHALQLAAEEAARRALPLEVAHVVSRKAGRPAGQDLLDRAMEAVPESHDATTRLLIGEPGSALVRASRKARMVLVGPRGMDGTQLLGPVALQLLRRGACPTLFVHGTTATGHWSPGTVPSAGTQAS
ncbi:universal stress protein [Actinoplanes sp. NPDC051470]|uniref:universal stress protein n=1 Tax=unclassified Actinoplanes TaxID=2626549 RepID=UPI0034390DA1